MQIKYNALRLFTIKFLCDFFSEGNELELAEIFNNFQKSMQESFGYSFSKIFLDDLRLLS